jgi:predicted RNA-binding Zn-ribbon protein involved in translation (DUF1610 family)
MGELPVTLAAELSCPQCRWSNPCGPAAMLGWLRDVKMVRRDTAPDEDLLGELFRSSAPKYTCPQCGRVGLVARDVPAENDEDWGMARACQACRRPIPSGRLEAFPDARLCVACQAQVERGEDTGPAEYCPRCGNIMRLKQTRSSGVTRYVLACPQCRK